MSGRFTALDSNITLLQEMINRDPESYRTDFEEKLFEFYQRSNLFNFETTFTKKDVDHYLELVSFLSTLAPKYPEHSLKLGDTLISILSNCGTALHQDLRMGFCKALVHLRNRRVLDNLKVFELFIELVKCEDKHLRKFVLGSLVSFIKQISKHGQDRKAEGRLQNFLIAKLQDTRSVVARTAQLVLIDAFRRNFWRHAKFVNAIAECVFHKSARIQTTAIRFFLGSLKEEEGESDTDSDDEKAGKKDNDKTIKEVMLAFKFVKKTKKRVKNLEKTKKVLNRTEKAKKESRSKYCNLEAIQLLFDAQAYIDRVFGLLESKKNEKFVIRLQIMALCARIIGVHKLQTLGFYSHMHRYLQPKQREVTRILLYVAQACHELVPPDVVEAVVKVIANNFVTDRNTPEAMTVGINAIREIFANCPFAATEELLRDLTEYKTYKNKNVSMAARGLITLFRAVNPKMLSRKDRGRQEDEILDEITGPVEFAANKVVSFIPGAEVLPEDVDPNAVVEEDDTSDSDTDSEDGWIDVDKSGHKDASSKPEADDSDVEEADSDDEDDGGFEDADDDEEGWVTDNGDDEEEEEEVTESDDEGGVQVEDEDETESKETEDLEPAPKKNAVGPSTQKKLDRLQKKAVRREQRQAQKTADADKALKVSSGRILTDADFKKIRMHNLKKQVGAVEKKSDNRKRTNDEEKLDDELEEKRLRREAGGDGLARLNDILHFHTKIRRQNKEERLETIREGREGREDYGKRKKKGEHVGRTNRELAKHKDFRMVRQKIRGRNRQRSFRDRQVSLRKYLLRQSGKKPQ